MKRIAVISTNRNKYSETFIHNHVRQLPAEVHYLTGGYLPTEASVGWGGEVQSLLQKKTIWPARNQPRDPASLRGRITDYLRKNRIEVVLAEYGPSGVEMMAPCREAGIPLVVHFHGYDAYRQDMLAAFGHRYQELFRQAAAIIAVSRHMQQHLISMGAPAEKVHWNPCGPDEAFFKPDPDRSPVPGRFLAAGRFAETKSPHLTLLAFARVVETSPQASLVFCGEGHLEMATRILAKALGLEAKVEFKGKVSQAELATEMSRAVAFVQHSVTTPENDREGTPVAIQEAGLAGLPVIATRHAGIPDVIIEEETGILVDEFDVEGMTKAMQRMIREPELSEQLGRAAHRHIKENFSLESHLRKLWGIIVEAG